MNFPTDFYESDNKKTDYGLTTGEIINFQQRKPYTSHFSGSGFEC